MLNRSMLSVNIAGLAKMPILQTATHLQAGFAGAWHNGKREAGTLEAET